MKNHILALLLVAFTLVRAQEFLETIVDNFDERSALWEPNHRENIYIEAINGVLEVDYYGKDPYATLTEYEFFYPSKKFIFKAAFTHIDVEEHEKIYGDGLVWGEDNNGNFYAFTLNNEREFLIYKVENGKQKKLLKEWQTSTAIKGKGDFDELAIEKEGLQTIFYINGTEVHRMNQEKFFGPGYGLMVERNTRVGFDYFSVTHPRVSINLVEGADFGTSKINIGEAINSYYHEFVPVISPDGTTMYFSRKNHPENMGWARNEDVWMAQKNKQGKWEKAHRFDASFNNFKENEVLSVTPDGNMLLLSGHYDKNGKYDGIGLSISQKTAKGWSLPTPIKIHGFDFKKEHHKISATLANDEKVIIFAAAGMKNSFGNTDLYAISLLPDGTWSLPMNLGPAINTPYKEETPFLASDEKTLFYSSDGMPGYGKSDIFVIKRLDDSWQRWTEARNLGPVVNSAEWDAYFSVPASGDTAYVVSTHDAIGETDIFKVKIALSAKPEPVVLVRGKVYNNLTKEPIEAKITYHELSSDLEMGIAHSDPVDGSFEIVMARGKKYSFYAEKKGYYAIREHIDEIELVEYQEIEKDLYLAPLATGSLIRLNNIFFERSKEVILPESFPELNKLVGLMNANHSMEIEVGGHTDALGSAAVSLELSQKRADEVKNYLVGKGIDKKRISTVGYGGTKPIADNSSEESRAKNRRVEIRIVKI